MLVEDEPDAVVVTVRDDGPGIPEGRLEAARARAGSAWPSRSGAGCGTSAARRTVISAPGQGTEVELRVPPGARAIGRSRADSHERP